MKQKNMIIMGLVVIIVGVAAFFGGMQYQKNQRPAFGNFAGEGTFQARFGQGGNGAGGQARRLGAAGGGAVVGEILSVDSKSMTVKLPDGSSKIVLLSTNTSINKAETAATSDLKVGVKVAAFGTSNSDGSVTAVNVQLNPMEQMRAPKPSITPAQ